MSGHSERASGPGRYVVGVDLGGTKIRAGIATSSGSIVADKKIATGAGGAGAVEQILTLIDDLRDSAGIDAGQVAATGIGGAGVPGRGGTTFDLAPNLTRLGSVPFVDRLSEELGHPVVIENDANVAAIGELHYGLGLTYSDFVFVSVGTGIGMGVVANGHLVRGVNGAAGEIGFLPWGADPLDPVNQVRGPLEEVTAGDAIVRRYRLATGSTLSTEDIFTRSGEGDPAATTAVDEEAKFIAGACVAVNAVLNPAVFVLGGGIGSRTELLPRIDSWLARYGAPALDLRISELGHRAPVAGAVQLALEAIRSPQEGPTP